MTAASQSELTPLEHDLLRHFHARHKQIGFPAPEIMSVKCRENTGAGRFTYLNHDGQVSHADGQFDLGKFAQINMEGLEAGASFWVQIENGKVYYLEIAVNGEQPWDGTEGKWAVCDPETGAFSDLRMHKV